MGSINMALQPCRDCGARPGRPHFDGCPLDGLLASITPVAPSSPPPPPKFATGTPQADALHRAIRQMGG